MPRKKFKLPNPEQVEALFSTVDDTGHSNEMKARKQRMYREINGTPRELDPLSETNPAGERVEKLIKRTALLFVLITMMFIILAQVSCGVARRAATANLGTQVSYDTVYQALEGGVEWGDGFTQFPEDFKVIEANERTHRVEVSVVNISSSNEVDLFASSNIQSTAFAVNALLNPDIDVVVYHVDVHQDENGAPEKSSLLGLVKPKGEVKRFMSFVWSKHATENGVNFTSSITGADPKLMDKLQSQLHLDVRDGFFGIGKNPEEVLYKYKTEAVGNATKVGKIVSGITYPKDIKYDSIELLTDEKPYCMNVILSGVPIGYDIDLGRQATIMFALISKLDEIGFVDAETSTKLVSYTRHDIANALNESDILIEDISKSQSSFTEFINKSE